MNKNSITFGSCLALCLSTLSLHATTESFKEEYSYALGYELNQDAIFQQMPFDVEALKLGLNDALNKRPSRLSEQESRKAQHDIETRLEAWQKNEAQRNKAIGAEFLKQNAKRRDIVTLDSGLQYRVIQSNSGREPNEDQNAKIEYTARLIDGTPVDFSFGMPHPITVTLSGGLVDGLTEGLLLMREGDEYEFFIKGDLGYGDDGNAAVPPGATLIVQLKLIELLDPPE